MKEQIDQALSSYLQNVTYPVPDTEMESEDRNHILRAARLTALRAVASIEQDLISNQ